MRIFLIFSFFLFTELYGQQSAFLLEYRTGNNPVSDQGKAIQKTSDNGFIIAGNRDPVFSSTYDLSLIKTDSDGGVQWAYSYDLGGSEEFSFVKQTSDGGYLLYGKRGTDIITLKTTNTGTPSWAWSYAGFSNVEPSKFRQTAIGPDGGYILAGQGIGLGSGGGFRDGYLLRLRTDGSIRWAYAYGTSTREDCFNDVAEDPNGHYSIAGNYDFSASSQAMWYLIDSIGSSIRRNRQIATGGLIDYFSASYIISSAPVGEGRYILAGRIGTNVYVARTCEGNCTGLVQQWRYKQSITTSDGTSNYSTEAYSIDSVPGENAFWITGKIIGGKALDPASLEQDFFS